MYDFFLIFLALSQWKLQRNFMFCQEKTSLWFHEIFWWQYEIFENVQYFFCSSNGTSCYYWSKLSRFWYNGNGVVGDSRGDWIILRQSACGSFSLYPGSPGNFLLAKALTEKKNVNELLQQSNFQGETYTTFSKLVFRKF